MVDRCLDNREASSIFYLVFLVTEDRSVWLTFNG